MIVISHDRHGDSNHLSFDCIFQQLGQIHNENHQNPKAVHYQPFVRWIHRSLAGGFNSQGDSNAFCYQHEHTVKHITVTS